MHVRGQNEQPEEGKDIYWYNSSRKFTTKIHLDHKEKDIVLQDKLPKDQGLAHYELHPYK